jgi:hypothetical protein
MLKVILIIQLTRCNCTVFSIQPGFGSTTKAEGLHSLIAWMPILQSNFKVQPQFTAKLQTVTSSSLENM